MDAKRKKNKMFGRKKKEEVPAEQEVPKIYQKPEKKVIAEEPKEETKEEKEIIQVVKELPTAPIRKYKNEKGQIVNLITIEEALTELANSE